MCCHSSGINSRRQQHQDYYSCINKKKKRKITENPNNNRSSKRSMLSNRSVLVSTDKLWTWIDQGGKSDGKTFFFLCSFDFISSRGSTVSHQQMKAVICGQDNPIRTGFSDRNAIKSLKWIGYLRGDKRRIRYTSKPAQ